MPDITELINKELKIIADAKAQLKEYQSQLTELNAKVKLELGHYDAPPRLSSKVSADDIDAPTEDEVLEALTMEPKSMGQLVKSSGYGAGQLRKVLAALEARGKVEKSGQKRATKYAAKK